jgi:hypothetical protein
MKVTTGRKMVMGGRMGKGRSEDIDVMTENGRGVEEIADVYSNPTLIYHVIFPLMPFIRKDYSSTP